MKRNHELKTVTFVTLVLVALLSQETSAIVNEKIDRIIDLSSQLVKITERIQIDGPTDVYILKLDPSHEARLAYIEATLGGQQISLAGKQDGSYEADLAGRKLDQPLVVTSIYTRLLEPYPQEISQDERQLVRYRGLQVTLSPYLTRTVTTKIKLPPSARLESFTKASKMNTDRSRLTYGPFKDIQPNQAEALTIHYENNNPFIAVTNLERSIELSPWSRSINIVNQVRVEHIGAKLKGPFSRLEYQRDHANGLSSVRSLMAELPRASAGIFYRDAIGNISTSNVRLSGPKTMVNIKPRFPLFGGWVTDFNLGYRIPLSDFLNEPKSGSNFRLSIPASDILYENMFVDEAMIKVYLPAGASNIDINTNIEYERLADELSYSYLDVIGRPVIKLRKTNLVSNHIEGKPLIIRFDYNKMYMLQEPILLIVAILGTFALFALFSKLTSTSQKGQGLSSGSSTVSAGGGGSKPKSD